MSHISPVHERQVSVGPKSILLGLKANLGSDSAALGHRHEDDINPSLLSSSTPRRSQTIESRGHSGFKTGKSRKQLMNRSEAATSLHSLARLLFALSLAARIVSAQDPAGMPRNADLPVTQSRPVQSQNQNNYVLGSDDEITFWSVELEDINNKTLRIDNRGDIHMPLIGQLHAAGLTTGELQTKVDEALKRYMHDPQVTVTIVNFNSKPVSVLGAVNTPGVYQIKGHRTLVEALAMAGGLRPDAGQFVKITRRLEYGRIPISLAHDDPEGQYSIAEVNVKALMNASNPEDNVAIQQDDIISVPRGEMVYVVGEVQKAGGFLLDGQHSSLTVLQAVALAGGLNNVASPQHSKIIRKRADTNERSEVMIDLKKILNGTATDVELGTDDVLFVPSSTTKKASVRAIEAIIQTASGVVIWHGL